MMPHFGPSDSYHQLLIPPFTVKQELTELVPTTMKILVDRPAPRRVRNPKAGLVESRWYAQHKAELVNSYAKQWVAILGESVVRHELSFEKLHTQLSQDELYDAFIQFVPDDADDSAYLIA